MDRDGLIPIGKDSDTGETGFTIGLANTPEPLGAFEYAHRNIAQTSLNRARLPHSRSASPFQSTKCRARLSLTDECSLNRRRDGPNGGGQSIVALELSLVELERKRSLGTQLCLTITSVPTLSSLVRIRQRAEVVSTTIAVDGRHTYHSLLKIKPRVVIHNGYRNE